ncbi:hypothetical protein Lalb_Chr16g0391331 [Lupinus albus]|uniref:Uncharacterized protein n=1 Tax=Lupinus albus TaxID=3870 RepID=A0A6A4P5A5_LUPAL|nr:hypothetical protein Lalb_Chr16g0391331 [Lupinus albus]
MIGDDTSLWGSPIYICRPGSCIIDLSLLYCIRRGSVTLAACQTECRGSDPRTDLIHPLNSVVPLLTFYHLQFLKIDMFTQSKFTLWWTKGCLILCTDSHACPFICLLF